MRRRALTGGRPSSASEEPCNRLDADGGRASTSRYSLFETPVSFTTPTRPLTCTLFLSKTHPSGAGGSTGCDMAAVAYVSIDDLFTVIDTNRTEQVVCTTANVERGQGQRTHRRTNNKCHSNSAAPSRGGGCELSERDSEHESTHSRSRLTA